MLSFTPDTGRRLAVPAAHTVYTFCARARPLSRLARLEPPLSRGLGDFGGCRLRLAMADAAQRGGRGADRVGRCLLTCV